MDTHENSASDAPVSACRAFLRAILASWISISSIVVAYLAFVDITESQDLLLDVRKLPSEGVIFWTLFFLSVYFLWVNMVTGGARLLMLQRMKTIGISTQRRFDFFISVLPKIYSILVYTILFCGLAIAFGNMPGEGNGNVRGVVILYIVFAIAFTYFFLQYILNFCYHRLRRYVGVVLALMVPIGLYVFLVFLVFRQIDAESDASTTIEAYTRNHLVTLLIFTIVSLIVAIYDNFFRVHRFRLVRLLERRYPQHLKRFTTSCETVFGPFPIPLDAERLGETCGPADGFLDGSDKIQLRWELIQLIGAVLLVAVLALVLIAFHFISYAIQGNFGQWLPENLWLKRAAFVPLVMGGTISLLTVMALLSHRLRFPVIVAIVLVGWVFTLVVGDGHDVRRIYAGRSGAPLATRFVDLNKSISAWKTSNGWNKEVCEPHPRDPSCPRPIIVVAEGGASRSAFFTASVLAKLEDVTAEHPNDLRRFSEQLFAISSVSGGSLGAGIFAGLVYAERKNKQISDCFAGSKSRDCVKGMQAQHLWFRNIVTSKAGRSEQKFTRQAAAEAISSNDFLTSTFIALLARDALQLSTIPWIWDRAAILEASWEDAVQGVLGPIDAKGNGDTDNVLGKPLSAFSWEEGSAWRPLLLFNSASTTSGRRVIATTLNPVAKEPNGTEFRVFTDTHNFYEIACDEDVDVWWISFLPRLIPRKHLCTDMKSDLISRKMDIRLSTAISLSSRFPLITPHGNIRNENASIAERVVDGGFFDNSGGVTAFEMAASIKRVDPNLRPYILHISNEPEFYRSCPNDNTQKDKPRLTGSGDFSALGTLIDLLTLNTTRTARSALTGFELSGRILALNADNPEPKDQAACIPEPEYRSYSAFFPCSQSKLPLGQVWWNYLNGRKVIQDAAPLRQPSEKKSISMSWWLSPPVQDYLHAEICGSQNGGGKADNAWPGIASVLRKPSGSYDSASACDEKTP